MDPYIGKVLDNRYEILERIGTGGMAVVYKAKDPRLNRLVAVKILKSDLAQDEDFRRRFNAESQAVAQLSHPNIVSIYDVSRGGDTEYIVMELIDGITLKQYMEKRGQLTWKEALHFITQIMRALSHAHSRGIVHRDIKPQNIMVLRDGSVRVADFGIACLENSAQTMTQEALGSVHYISPEQARGDRIDARSDIYSAGVVLYEMLTSRRPFEGESAVSVAIQHLSAIPLAPREINPDIPETLELICLKAMAPDLSKRYASADAMIADLEAFRKNPGVVLEYSMDDLHPEESDEPTRPIRTAHTIHHSDAGVASYKSQRNDDEDDYRAPPYYPRKKNSHRGLLIGGGVVAAVVVIVVLFVTIFKSFGGEVDEYVVPNVIGYTQEQAEELDGVKGIFEIQVVGKRASDKYDEGVIVDQDPSENTTKKSNLVIEVWISSGENSVEMPDLFKDEARAAEIELKGLKLDLNIETEEQFDNEITTGYVISTDPVAGTELHEGDTVTLVVSKGPEQVTVVPFEGQLIDDVRKKLESMGLVCGEVTPVESDKPAGTVLSQSIDGGTEVDANTKIDFTVSSGTSSVTMDYTYSLPTDRETVHLKITVAGEEQFSDTVDCSLGSITVQLKGSGSCRINVYEDDVLTQTETVVFS